MKTKEQKNGAKESVLKRLLIVPFIILILVTLFFNRPMYTSSMLTSQKTESETEVRTDYVDDKGIIRQATDLGYATKIVVMEDGRKAAEQYYDEKGNAAALPAGYSSVRYVYGDGYKRIEYLDAQGQPVVINNDYDTICRTIVEDGKDGTDTYYIAGVQVARKDGYWQYKRVYNADGLSEAWFLDKDGKPVNSASGYALLRRNYSEAGRTDFYFDSELQPVALSLGQYGVRYEDGVTTYLDADGRAVNTTKGYAIIKRDGDKTLYFDKDEHPVTIGRYQYGVKRVDGQNVFLDENGKEMLRLDNILNTHPFYVLVMGIAATAIAVLAKGKGRIGFVAAYIFFIGIMTIFYRENGEQDAVFELFRSYKSFLSSPGTRQNILNNIWLFVPLGAALYCNKPLWLVPVMLSVLIELIQLKFGIGMFELDDIFNNSLGGAIGFLFACGAEKIRGTARRKEPGPDSGKALPFK